MLGGSARLRRRHWLLAASTALLSLPACSASEDAQRTKAGLPPLTPEQRQLRHKFRGLSGGQLVVDAFGEKHAVTILDENDRVFYTSATLSPRNRSKHSYGAEFGVPVTLRAIWRSEGEEVGGVIQNPIRMTQQYGIYEGGTVAGDYTVAVAEQIPEELLDAMRNGVGGFRLKIRIHPDGPLIGWDLSRGFNLQYFAGGHFREADIENGKVLRKGWYIHPKTGEKIETDF
jgi:hypothetical protein